MAKDAKKLIKDLSALVGKPDAKRFLVQQGISPSTADKLVREKYKNEVGLLIRDAILRAFEGAKRQAS